MTCQSVCVCVCVGRGVGGGMSGVFATGVCRGECVLCSVLSLSCDLCDVFLFPFVVVFFNYNYPVQNIFSGPHQAPACSSSQLCGCQVIRGFHLYFENSFFLIAFLIAPCQCISIF